MQQRISEKLNFGTTFQLKVVTSLITNQSYLEQIIDIIEPSYFDNDSVSYLIKKIRNYYLSYKIKPTTGVLRVFINEITEDVLKTSVKETLKQCLNLIDSTDLQFVQDKTLEFCKNQRIRNVILESVDLVELGKYEEIKLKLDLALKSGTEKNVGHDYNNDIDLRYTEDPRNAISTPWGVLNKYIDGGLGKGELGIVAAGAGLGKCIGGDSIIEIRYDKIGIKVNDKLTVWFNPFDKVDLGDELVLYAYQIDCLFNSEYETVTSTIKISDVFRLLEIDYSIENNIKQIDFKLEVKTPNGFKQIVELFTTESQFPVISKFENNTELKTSSEHLLFVNNLKWKKIKDISETDIIQTDNGTTHLISKHYLQKREILFDMQVEDVHCYYANGILSHNSWTLLNLAAQALRQGKTVVYYTMELSEFYVAKRFDAHFTQIPSQIVNSSDVRKVLNNLPGQLIIKYYPTKSPSILTLQSHYERTVSHIKKPDLLIIDYPDLMKSNIRLNNNKRTDEILGDIYGDIRGMAGEYQIPIWAASQLQRSSNKNDINESDSIASSYEKIMIADLVMMWSRKLKDKLKGTARLHIAKNRFGEDGITFPAKLDLKFGNITLFEPKDDDEDDDEESTNHQPQKSKNENDMREHARNRYNEFNNKEKRKF